MRLTYNVMTKINNLQLLTLPTTSPALVIEMTLVDAKF